MTSTSEFGDAANSRVDPATAKALGLLSKALETTERARGHLYSFHQLTGTADFELGDAIDALRAAGHVRIADQLANDLLGRNVIDGRWTFQVVEDYDDSYWSLFRHLEQQARVQLADGRRHLYEADLKQKRRTRGHPNHTEGPDRV